MRHALRLLLLPLLLVAAPSALALDDEVEVEGPITALTATDLTVDGLTFTMTDATEIRGGDGPATADDLALGLTVEVRGETRADGALVATRIEIEDGDGDDRVRLEGAITDRAEGAVRVGVVWVFFDDATEIRGDDGPATAADLVIGVRVEVRGAADADGRIVASRIEIDEQDGDDDDEDVEVEGVIESLGAFSLTVRGTFFEVTDATRITGDDDAALPFEALAVGQLVEVHAAFAPDGGLVATRIEVEDFEDDEVELTGAIEALESAALVVAGLRFEVSGATIILDNDRLPIPFEALALGQIVEIRADVDASGVRRATHIKLEDTVDDEVEVKAVLDAVGDGLVVTLGVAFGVDDATIRPAGLAAGDVVELHARLSPSGDLLATQIEREDAPASAVRLRGPVTAVAPDSLAVIGVPFSVDAATVLVGRDGSPTTLDAVGPGASVEVTALVVDGGWLATRVEVRSAAQAAGRVGTADAAGFTVGGLAVRLSASTQIVGGDGEPLARVEIGQTVRASGTTAAGALDATRVTVLSAQTATAAGEDRGALRTPLSVSPNPLTGVGRVRYALAEPATVEIAVYSVLGREVARIRASGAAGAHEVALDAGGLPSGLYLVRFVVDGRGEVTTPLTVVR